MNQIFTIPQQNIEFITEQIQLVFQTKQAIVHVSTRPSGSEEKPSYVGKTIDVLSAFSGSMSGSEITAFTKGIKLIVSEAWGSTLEDLTGDPF